MILLIQNCDFYTYLISRPKRTLTSLFAYSQMKDHVEDIKPATFQVVIKVEHQNVINLKTDNIISSRFFQYTM